MKASKLFWLLTVLPLIIALVCFSFLPERIPAHYGADGEVDRWGSRWEIFIFPVVAVIVSPMLRLIIGKLVQRYSTTSNRAVDWLLLGLPIVFLALTVTYSLTALTGIEKLGITP